LRRTLAALAQQTYPPRARQVIVVDDGSTDHTRAAAESAPIANLRYCRQPHRGATLARNHGAEQATGELLVFVDDDIELLPDTLAELIAILRQPGAQVVLGTLLSEGGGAQPADAPSRPADCVAVPFTECFTGLLAVRAADFRALGMFEDPTGGWPNWDDIDFGYRAQRAGYRIVRSVRGRAIHRDAAARSLALKARRAYQASHAAPRLFRRYPDIAPNLPMFFDKGPVGRDDPPALIVRKLLRRIASTALAVAALEWMERVARRVAPRSAVLQPLQRWIVGAYIYNGFRDGLRDLE
jgi:glycosyltransferase involved in cell wall biosynthesis